MQQQQQQQQQQQNTNTNTYSKTIDFVIDIPAEASFVSLCTGMVHHGSEFRSNITLQVEDGAIVDLKSILGIMSLCYANGRRARITISGDDHDDVEGAYMCLNKYLDVYSHKAAGSMVLEA